MDDDRDIAWRIRSILERSGAQTATHARCQLARLIGCRTYRFRRQDRIGRSAYSKTSPAGALRFLIVGFGVDRCHAQSAKPGIAVSPLVRVSSVTDCAAYQIPPNSKRNRSRITVGSEPDIASGRIGSSGIGSNVLSSLVGFEHRSKGHWINVAGARTVTLAPFGLALGPVWTSSTYRIVRAAGQCVNRVHIRPQNPRL